MDRILYKKRTAQHLTMVLLTTMLLVGHVLSSAAQANVTITGKVTSTEDGSAIPGVNVYLKGTQNGTISGGD